MPWYIWVLLVILFLLLLKVFRVLPDPPEYLEIIAGIGASVGVVGSFATLFTKMFSFEKRLSTVEAKIEIIMKDIAEIKTDFKEMRSIIDRIKGKRGIV